MMLACRNHPEAEGPIAACERCQQPFCLDCLVTLQGHRFCADCKSEHVRDIASGVDRVNLELATIGRRFTAILIDQLIMSTPLFVMIGLAVLAAAVADGSAGSIPDEVFPFVFIPMLIVAVLVSILYEPLLLSRDGQTFGKKWMKIRVVREDGGKISRGQAWGRFALRSLLGFIDYIPAPFTPERLCVHDMAAKTRVVNVR